MGIELRDLEYFATVAKQGSIGRAAEALEMSQPAVSKSLRRLEQAVGAKVVKRTAKGVDLTAVGHALLARARRLRLTLDDISREAADLSAGRAGPLRIGANARLAVKLVPAACEALAREAPGVQLKIDVEEANRGAPAVARGEIDLYITANPIAGYEDVVQERLYEEDWGVIASARHRLAGRKRVTLDDLARERWILGLYGPAQGDLLRIFAQRGLTAPSIAVEVNSMLFRRQLVRGTDWLTYGPRQFFREGEWRSSLAEIPVKGLQSSRRVSVCYRKDAYLAPVARRFIEILKTTAKEIAVR
jgi:DNA-binding transcriptional LysR family regulator